MRILLLPAILTMLLAASLTAWTAQAGANAPDPAKAAGYAERPEAQALIEHLQAEYGLKPGWVRAQLAAARFQPDIVAAMRRPAERVLEWHEYREIFIQPARIAGGIAFVQENRALFERAEERFGVPPAIIAAIIGVETRYGEVLGNDRVLDALATLGFDYPERADFFRAELGHFLVLAREEDIDVRSAIGSYAGAMGLPQFIPSSYRAYAVDFDDDGQRDLWHSRADVIGSVANYLAVHGWQAGAPVAELAATDGAPQGLEPSNRKTRYAYRELVANGVRTVGAAPPPDTRVGLVKLMAADGPEYWVGFNNFFVITSYNHSRLYAMAVHQLAAAIAAGLKSETAAR